MLAKAALAAAFLPLVGAGEVMGCSIGTVFSDLQAIKDNEDCRSGCRSGSGDVSSPGTIRTAVGS